MSKKFWSADLIEMIEKEESTPNGNLENILDFILELEKSGEYPIDNICKLKSVCYYYLNDNVSSLYWSEQAYLLESTDTGYGWTYVRRLMDFNRFDDALIVLSNIINLEKETGIQYYTSLCTFVKAICYYYLKDYKNCYHYLKDLEDDYSCWVAGGLHSKAEMMNVLKGFGYD